MRSSGGWARLLSVRTTTCTSTPGRIENAFSIGDANDSWRGGAGTHNQYPASGF